MDKTGRYQQAGLVRLFFGISESEQVKSSEEACSIGPGGLSVFGPDLIVWDDLYVQSTDIIFQKPCPVKK